MRAWVTRFLFVEDPLPFLFFLVGLGNHVLADNPDLDTLTMAHAVV